MSTPKALKFAGLMGHNFVVLEPSDHWTATDGWRVVAQCSTLASACRDLQENQQVWQRTTAGWKHVKQIQDAVSVGEVVNCTRCGKSFVPMDAGRKLCVGCLKQQSADANLQRMTGTTAVYLIPMSTTQLPLHITFTITDAFGHITECNTHSEALNIARLRPQCTVERWTQLVRKNGSLGLPAKKRLLSK